MYKHLLILKYLRKRRIAWVSLIAVMLCTTMVLVVISVMGGWLRMFRESFHSISGDVIVEGQSMLGFPYYEEMIQRIEGLPEVKAAAPVIRSFGLVNIALYGQSRILAGVSVIGYPANISEVNGFGESLYRMKGDKEISFGLVPGVDYKAPPGFNPRGKNPKTWDGMIVGSGVIGLKKDRNGNITNRDTDAIYQASVVLTVMPLQPKQASLDITSKTVNFYWIVDDSRTKVHLYDSNTVYVAFKTLQRDLQMDGSDGQPARTRDIQIALKPGADLAVARQKIREVADAVTAEHGYDIHFPYEVKTWEETHAQFLNAVENEKSLVTFLFSIISVVAIFLIFCIFYMIVVEKTKDIGIIKSVGATSSGVAGIFLGYGAAIGVVGAGLGLLVGYLIVHNINWLHSTLAELTGREIWKSDVYLFDTIPNTMNPNEVAVILIVAIISSIIGALVPAIRAARMQPVEALRWE
ncbi:MAG: ABC transporter permease [Bacillota bacterium]